MNSANPLPCAFPDESLIAPRLDAVSTAGVGRLVQSDNLALMTRLASGSCDLIYVDPPFDGQGVAGRGANIEDAGGAVDRRDVHAYLAFLRPRLVEMHRLLTAEGSFYVHLDWRSVHYVKALLDDVFGSSAFLNEIVWSYRTGGRPGRWFARQHDTLLLYAKEPGRQTFHRLHAGRYRTRDLKYDDRGRPYKPTRNGRIHFHPDGPGVSDVWDIPFLSTVSKERTGYPSQKPEALLERVIRASSNEGDLVADFFCGSGTTPAVAFRLGRRYLACDINADAIAITNRRLTMLDAG